MKKYFVIILLLISFSYETKAFLGEDLGLDLYKNIDSGLIELEQKQYEYELQNDNGSIKEKINENLKFYEGIENCISEDLSVQDLEKIESGDLNILKSKISSECKNNNNLNIPLLNKIIEVAKKTKANALENIENKGKTINTVSKVGIYSDGIIENSPFDLMQDIIDIDKIIFGGKIDYMGEEYQNNDDLLDKLIKDKNDKNKQKEKTKENNKSEGNNNKENQGNNLVDDSYTLENNYLCPADLDQSGLNAEILENITKDIENGIKDPVNPNYKGYERQRTDFDNKSDGGYEKKRGNFEKPNFPCDSFFCITIEFITYTHKLLGSGENISIEYLVNRSNKHLKKFSATSLIQGSVSTNNWELGLKNLNLVDSFHMGFIVTSKPVPILNLKKDKKKNLSSKFELKNMLEEYYKNNNLEYSRRNDINNYTNKIEELKTTKDSTELTNVELLQKNEEFKEHLNKIKEKNKFFEKAIDKKITNITLENFEKQFIELQLFSKGMYDYAVSISAIIKKMKEIPIDAS